MSGRGAPLALALALLLGAAPSFAQEAVVIMGAEGPAYQQALEGFTKAFAGKFSVRRADERSALPASASVVVALGGRAAMAGYPADAALVVCMAPGLSAGSIAHRGPLAEVGILPPPRAVIEALLRAAAPRKRFGVLWTSRAFRPYVASLIDEAAARSASVYAVRAEHDEQLLNALRSMRGNVDAFWIPPDPAFASETRLKTLQETSVQWEVPWFGSTPGFSRFGVAGVVGASFASIGQAAARAATDALESRLQSRYYPEDVEVTK